MLLLPGLFTQMPLSEDRIEENPYLLANICIYYTYTHTYAYTYGYIYRCMCATKGVPK